MVQRIGKSGYVIIFTFYLITFVSGYVRPVIESNAIRALEDARSSFEDNVLNVVTGSDIQNASSYTSFLFHSRQVKSATLKAVCRDVAEFTLASAAAKAVRPEVSGANRDTTVKTGDQDILLNAGFSTSKLTKILIHGLAQNGSDAFSNTITNAFLDLQDLNVVSVTWAKYAFSPYSVATTAVPYVGVHVASFIDFLVQDVRVDISTIHVVGHSLGAQISGVVGENVVSGKLPWISGLDPAGPLYFNSSTRGRLDASDAKFVDVIHTAAGTFGFADPCGTVDFYANGGFAPQPGCIGGIEPICSHQLSFYYYAESVSSYGFVATQCNSWWDYVTGVCAHNGTAVMGYHVDKRLKGVFYLTTNAASPYAQS